MKLRFLHVENDFWFRVMFVPFLGFLTPYITHMLPENYVHTLYISRVPSLFTLPVVFFIFEFNRIIMIKSKAVNLIDFEGYTFFLVKRVFSHLLITAILLLFFLLIWYHIILRIKGYNFLLGGNILIGLSISLAIIMIYEAGFFINIIIREMTKSHLLEIENTKSQTKLLKKQLAPHFIFNSLSTLMSLIEIDKEKAIVFLNKFSNSFRYVLTNSEEITIDIKSELEFVDDFISISKSNYGDDALFFSVDVKRKFQKFHIPTLAIQLLIENAMKHNKHTNQYPLYIDIYLNSEQTHLCVKNNLQIKKTSFSTKLGLDSISQRYKLIGDYSIEIDISEDYFEVKIPLIKDLKFIK